MPNTATVTAKQGPAITISSKSLLNMTGIYLDLVRQIIKVYQGDANYQEFDISANNTLTLTFSSGNYTLTVS